MPFSSASRAGGNAEFPPIVISGTAVAISNISKSARPFHAEQGFNGWGGARNWSGRLSESLSLKQATNIIEAAQFALAIGLPFNRHLTIHWERAGITDSRAATATARFIKLASDWIAKRGGQVAWAWVRENGDSKGSHVHILIHVPYRLITGENGAGLHADNTALKQRKGLGNMPRRWLAIITRKPYRAGTVRTTRIGRTACAAMSAPPVYHVNLAAVVGYVLKGVSADVQRALALDRIAAGGRVIGKRAGTSQNVGRAARQRLQK